MFSCKSICFWITHLARQLGALSKRDELQHFFWMFFPTVATTSRPPVSRPIPRSLLFRKAKESGNNSSFRSNLLLYTIPHSGRIGCYKYFRDCVLGTHVIVVSSIFGNKATTGRKDIKGEEKIEIWARIHILTQIWCFYTRSMASCNMLN